MIVPAAISDAKNLSEIAIKSKSYWKYTKEQIESWREDLIVSPRMIKELIVFKFVKNDKIAGFYILSQPKNQQIELAFLFVLPDFIGQKIGRKLLLHSFEKAIELNCKSMRVLSDPNALPFYNSQGFFQIDKQESSIVGRFLPILQKDF